MAYHKETARIYGGSDLKKNVDKFNKKADDHEEKQVKNPFSQQWKGTCGIRPKTSQPMEKTDANYGRPVHGSKTEYRGMKAGQLVNNEILTLCEMMNEFGVHNDDGTVWITFKELFEIYTRISNKLVGMLLRGRKHGLIHFEGEMLFQRRDDFVIITLMKTIEEIRIDAGLPDPREFKNPFANTDSPSTSS